MNKSDIQDALKHALDKYSDGDSYDEKTSYVDFDGDEEICCIDGHFNVSILADHMGKHMIDNLGDDNPIKQLLDILPDNIELDEGNVLSAAAICDEEVKPDLITVTLTENNQTLVYKIYPPFNWSIDTPPKEMGHDAEGFRFFESGGIIEISTKGLTTRGVLFNAKKETIKLNMTASQKKAVKEWEDRLLRRWR